MKLKSDFVFFDPAGKGWLAPAGAIVDGASIPEFLWSIIGGPLEGKYRAASVVHDVACVEKKEPYEDVHRMFYFACRCAGEEELRAKLMYAAVAFRGPRWKLVQEVKEIDGSQFYTSHGVEEQKAYKQSDQDIEKILKFIKLNNPDVREITNLKVIDGKVVIQNSESPEHSEQPPTAEPPMADESPH